MEYSIFEPDPRLKPFLCYFWAITGSDPMPQKVVCDGYSELIFHFADPYQIKINDCWHTQSMALAAGQIDQPVLLQPQGHSDIFGLKFTPTGLWRLFNLNMRLLKNEVVPLLDVMSPEIGDLQSILNEGRSHQERIEIVKSFLLERLRCLKEKQTIDTLVNHLYRSEGQISITSLARDFKLSTRRMERLFNEQVGVPPKAFARMIRFKRVYQLLQKSELNTSEVSHLCGYFDQAHLNKDFKIFSGEDPKNYFSGGHALARFFLKS
jgi:AraC-like DNA-binding protein